ncbi:MAG: hypothetical protein GEV06_22460 [Luteitalea sp.]|nr:hypothetical protein [Luteitalea sp.]
MSRLRRIPSRLQALVFVPMNEAEIAALLRCSIRMLYRLKALERRTRAGFFPAEIPGLRGRYWKEDVIRCFKRGAGRRDNGRKLP